MSIVKVDGDEIELEAVGEPVQKTALAPTNEPRIVACGWCGGQQFGEILEDNEMQCMTCLNYVVAMNSLGEKAGDAAFLNRAARAIDGGLYMTAEQLARFSRPRKL